MNKHDSMQYQIRDPKGFANMLDRDVDRSFYNEKLIFCLKNTIASDGFVYAAFYDGKLKGFVSVESEIFGGKQGYCDLSSIHISKDMRRKGIGRTLFLRQKNGRNKKELKSSTYLHTQPLKVKPFINQWGVLRQKFIIKNMLKMNRMIVN